MAFKPTKIITQEPQEKESLSNKVTDFFGLGPALKRAGGELFRGTDEYKNLESSVQSGQEIEQKLIARISEGKRIGKDTSRLEQALKEQRISNTQARQAYEGLPTGGVTDKQLLGGALTTASWIPGGMALKGAGTAAKTIYGASKAGKSLSTAAKGLNTLKGTAAEAGVSGFLGGAGANLENDPRATFGSAVGTGVGAGILGAGLGAGIHKLAPQVAGRIGSAFAKYGSPEEARMAADAVAEWTKALPPSGKKTPYSFLRDYTGGESSRSFNGMQALYENNMNKTVKGLDGFEIEFDPKNVSIEHLPFMYKQAADTMQDEMLSRLSKLSQKGLTVSMKDAAKEIVKGYNNAVSKEVKAYYRKYLEDLGVEFTSGGNPIIKDLEIDPLALRTYLTEIGAKVGPYVNTGTNKIEGSIATKVYKESENALNNFFSKEQVPIKELYDQYSALKQLEFDTTKAVSKAMRDAGKYKIGDAIDDYGLSLIGSGLMYGNVAQMSKGGLLVALKGFRKFMNNPEKAVKNAFGKVDEYYTKKGITSSIPPVPERGLVPVGEPYGPGSTRSIPVAPSGSNIEYTGRLGVEGKGRPAAPKSNPRAAQIRAAQEATPPYMTEAEMPTIDYGPGAVPAETGLPNIEQNIDSWVNTLPEAQQEKAREALKTLLELSKKKINNEGGFSSIQTLLAGLGITGAGALATKIPGSKTTYEAPEQPEEVKPKQGLDPVSIKEKIAYRETRGEEDPYSAENENKNGSIDYGKYQVNEGTLKEWSERALGKLVSPAEFVKSPELQEKFIDYVLNRFINEYEIEDVEHALAMWHKGWGPEHINNPKLAKEKAAEYIKEPKD